MPAQLLVISAIAFTAVYLQIVLLLCPSAVAHECRRAGIVEQEVKLVALSRRLSAVKRAKEAAGPSVAVSVVHHLMLPLLLCLAAAAQ